MALTPTSVAVTNTSYLTRYGSTAWTQYFAAIWKTYNSVSPYEYWAGESCPDLYCRIKLSTDASGCSSISWNGAGTREGGTMYWAVTTSTSKPANSAGTAASFSSNKWSGSKSVSLLPNTTYYLWIWPDTTSASNHTVAHGSNPVSVPYNRRLSGPVSITGSGAYGVAGNITTKISGTDVTAANFGDAVTLGYAANPTNNATYTVKVSLPTDSGTYTATLQEYNQSSGAGTTSRTWTPAVATFAPLITNKTSVTATISVTTYYGTVSVGTKTKNITLSFLQSDVGIQAASNWATCAWNNTGLPNATSQAFSGYIEKYSRATLTLTSGGLTWPNNYGELSTTTFSVKVMSDSAVSIATSSGFPYNTKVLTESGTIRVIATDKRGFAATQDFAITLLPYGNPVVNAVYTRANSGGNTDPSGSYLKITPTASFSSLEYSSTPQNSITSIVLTMTPKGGSSSTMNLTSGATTLIPSISPSTYTLTLVVTDVLGNTGTTVYTLAPGAYAMNFLLSTDSQTNAKYVNGVSFGKLAEKAATVDVGSWAVEHINTGGDDGFRIVANSIDENATPQADTVSPRFVIWAKRKLDKLAELIGKKLADGKEGLSLKTYRTINNIEYQNGLGMYIDGNGDSTVSVTNQSAWRAALGLGSIATLNSPLPIANGGTGGTTASEARRNIGVAYKPNDSFSATTFYGSGYITNSGKDLMFGVNMSLLMNSVSSLTISKFEISIRCNNAYVGASDASWTDIAQYITNQSRAGTVLWFKATKSAGWGVQNNTACAGSVRVTGTWT